MIEHNRKSTSVLLERSLIYQRYKAEKEEIDRHKWIESEKAGYDIGFDRAMFEWVRHHRNDFLNHYRDSQFMP